MSVNEKYMRLAIKLARKAEGKTSPNPVVGAVIVKNNRIIGKGYHKKAGMPHAEINALNQVGQKAKGATLYVTLEPCDHYGRTPPCTLSIIKSGIKKVVIGMQDPNPLNNGKGIKKLISNSIKVESGILEKEAAAINKPYIKFITTGLPYVTVKVAQSLDGKIATKTGRSKWISSEDSRKYVHELRGKVDAVMVGGNTVLKDDPSLLCRAHLSVPYSKISYRQPIRIIVAGGTKIPKNARVFSTTNKSPVMIVKSGSRKKVNLTALMKSLAKNNITNILVEGGGELIASLVEKKLVDRFLIFIAPKIIGGRSAKTAVEGSGIADIKDALMFDTMSVRKFKSDILIEAEI